ncbi:MAG: hypothetical protein ACI8XB_001350 [Patiriisocius sp.]|jgi:hypothetical protein
MTSFFEGMSSLEQTYWIIAMLGSAIFAIILVATFVGGDADMDSDVGDFEADDGGVGFQFFTFKNMVAFFTIFGWTGIAGIDAGLTGGTTIFIAALAGLLMMFLTSLLFYWMSKLAESGTLQMQNAVGVVGEVYLTVGAKRSNMGKIQITVQGSLRELDALTDSEVDLKSGSMIKVVDIVSAEILLVEKLA